MPEKISSLYVHVPFCAQKCAYCAFYSEASSGEIINRYVAALVREMEMVAGDLKPETIFFGGGTPSLLNLRQWETILRAMEKLGLLGAPEFSVECNPATVSLDKAKLLRDFGVNRISMGVQSLDEALLERLGRIHSREQVFKSFDILRRANFDNLNLDLMFAIPRQTMEIWRETLREALAMQSEHLSSYEVIYEDDTPLFHQLKAGEFDVDEDLGCDMYEELVSHAGAAGLRQYEVANFARDGCQPALHEPPRTKSSGDCHSHPSPSVSLPVEGRGKPNSFGSRKFRVQGHDARRKGVEDPREPTLSHKRTPTDTTGEIPSFACRHNVNYWRGGSFYGLGPSATGYVRGVRTKNWSNTQLYCEQLESGKRAIESGETLPPLKRAGETAAFGLRMVAGWPFEEFRRATDFDLRENWNSEMNELSARGWGRISSDNFRLTREGLRFADAAAEMFLR
ncbi:MAG TPA: radical SAM family heme chaperone HemW [Verrucomicrobiae bacterium]|nr:radical SAM family heme chaperone HemW [Verrucomicrobiae bacterium]